MHFVLLLALASVNGAPPWLTGESDPADLTVSLVTFSPGDTIPEWWGHTSFVVTDNKLKHQRLYNFGMFGPREGGTNEDFIKDFIKGRLIFWVDDESVPWTFSLYRRLDRDVRVQDLDLDPPEALEIARRLATNILPENRYYRYHHYLDNCSTRPRDIIDAAIGGQLKAATADASKFTYRSQALRYSRVNPPFSIVLDFLQGPMIDQPMSRQGDAYLPDELEKQLAALQVKHADGSVRPMVKRSWNFFMSSRPKPPEVPPNFLLGEVLVGLLLGGVALALAFWSRNGKRLSRVVFGLYQLLIGLVLGIFGAALGFLMAATDHDVTYGNENILQASPLSLGIIALAVMATWGSKRAEKWNRTWWALLAGLSLIGLVISPFTLQDNANVLALCVPVHLAFAAAWWRVKRVSAAQPSA